MIPAHAQRKQSNHLAHTPSPFFLDVLDTLSDGTGAQEN
jgi:hypothetical protein